MTTFIIGPSTPGSVLKYDVVYIGPTLALNAANFPWFIADNVKAVYTKSANRQGYIGTTLGQGIPAVTQFVQAAAGSPPNVYELNLKTQITLDSTAFSLVATTLTKLATPTGVAATPLSATVLSVTANAVPDAVSYRLYTSATETGTYTQLGGVISNPPYSHTGLSSSQQQWYKWQAVGNGTSTSDSDLSAAFSGTTTALQQLGQPAVTASAQTINSVTFIWIAIPGADSYQVSINSGPLVGTTTNSYTATGFAKDVTVTARVRALDSTNTKTTGDFSTLVTTKTAPTSDTFAGLNIVIDDLGAVNKIDKHPAVAEWSNVYGTPYAASAFWNGNATLKGRGNQSWTFPKKPYTLALAKANGVDSQKMTLLGLLSASKFTMLTGYQDPTQLRTAVTMYFSTSLGELAVGVKPVNVSVNGVYHGLYHVTDKVNEKTFLGLPSNGFLFQKALDDQENDENGVAYGGQNAFKTPLIGDVYDHPRHPFPHSIIVEYPEFGSAGATPAVLADAKNLVLAAEATLTLPWSDTVNGPQSKFVPAALFGYYFTQEWGKNADGESHSSYFRTGADGRIIMGPMWDADGMWFPYLSPFNTVNPTGEYISRTPWYRPLFKDADFSKAIGAYYRTKVLPAIAATLAFFTERANSLVNSGLVEQNNVKWDAYNIYPLASTGQVSTVYAEHRDAMFTYMTQRRDYFTSRYGTSTVNPDEVTITVNSVPSEGSLKATIPAGADLVIVDNEYTVDQGNGTYSWDNSNPAKLLIYNDFRILTNEDYFIGGISGYASTLDASKEDNDAYVEVKVMSRFVDFYFAAYPNLTPVVVRLGNYIIGEVSPGADPMRNAYNVFTVDCGPNWSVMAAANMNLSIKMKFEPSRIMVLPAFVRRNS